MPSAQVAYHLAITIRLHVFYLHQSYINITQKRMYLHNVLCSQRIIFHCSLRTPELIWSFNHWIII